MSFRFRDRQALQLILFSLLALGIVPAAALLFPTKPAATFLEKAQPPTVNVLLLQKTNYPLTLTTQGTVQSKKPEVLKAPIAGRLSLKEELYPGTYLTAKTAIFEITPIQSEEKIQALQAELTQNAEKREKSKADRALFASRIQSAKELLGIAQQAFDKQQSSKDIEEQLFSSNQQLHDNKSVSTTEYLHSERSLLKAELRILESRKELEEAKDQLNRLRLALNEVELQSKLLEEERATLTRAIEVEKTPKKTEVVFPTATWQTLKLFAKEGAKVKEGEALLSYRPANAVEVTAWIPQNQFKWLYKGNLLKQKKGEVTPNLSLHLLSNHYSKSFNGARIRGVGAELDNKSGALPLFIERENPLSTDGTPIIEEELKPGMQCQLSLQLCLIENSFVIPKKALQKNGSVLHVVQSPETLQPILSEIDQVEILFEQGDELVVRLPEKFEKLAIVTHPFKRAKKGQVVSLKTSLATEKAIALK